MREHWKTIGLVLLLLGAVVFVAARWRSGFRSAVPASIEMVDLQSPSLTWNAGLRGSWNHVAELTKMATAEAAKSGLSVGSLNLWSVQPAAKQTYLWTTSQFLNPGFNPLSRFDVSGGIHTNTLVGFYSLEGQPLRYSLKRYPGQSSIASVTIHLATPLPAGQTAMVFRVEERSDLVRTNAQGVLQVGLGRLAPDPARLQARGLVLPAGARILEHKPNEGAAMTRIDDQPVINWLSPFIRQDGAVLLVEFRLGDS